MSTRGRHRRKPNKNRIVRVRNKLMHDALISVSISTAYTYQECFEELCTMFQEGFVLGVNTRDELYTRVINKLPF